MKISTAMRTLLLGCLEFDARTRCLPGGMLDHRVTAAAFERGWIAWGYEVVTGSVCCLTPAGRKLALELAAEAGR